MSRWSKQIGALCPDTQFEEIYRLLVTCAFSWDIEKALEFALFRTYGVPSISGLLSRTGEFRRNTRKRYDDTELLLSEIAENGQGSDAGQEAIARMNAMHGRYRISNGDMLYVLSTFVVEPARWLDAYGKRGLTDHEKRACAGYYRALGERMGMADIPADFDGFSRFQTAYEQAHFSFADTNAEIGSVTRDLLLSMYLPRVLVPLGRPAVHALCDPALRTAMGFAAPPRGVTTAVKGGLALRRVVLRLLPDRRKPRLITARHRPTYPTGYRISQLGTFKAEAGDRDRADNLQ